MRQQLVTLRTRANKIVYILLGVTGDAPGPATGDITGPATGGPLTGDTTGPATGPTHASSCGCRFRPEFLQSFAGSWPIQWPLCRNLARVGNNVVLLRQALHFFNAVQSHTFLEKWNYWARFLALPPKQHILKVQDMDLFTKPCTRHVERLSPAALARTMLQPITSASLLAFEQTYSSQTAAVHALSQQYVVLVQQLVEALQAPDTRTSACRLLFWMLENDPALLMALPLVQLASLVDSFPHSAYFLAATMMQPHFPITAAVLNALPWPATAATYMCLYALADGLQTADAYVVQPFVQRVFCQTFAVDTWRLCALLAPKLSSPDELPVDSMMGVLHTSHDPELLEAALRCFQALLCAFPLCMLISVRSNPLPRLWGGSNMLSVCIAAAGAYAEWNKTSAEVCKPGKPMLPCVRETARVLCAFFASATPVPPGLAWQPPCVLAFLTCTANVWPEFPGLLFARPHMLPSVIAWCRAASSTMLADFVMALADAVPPQLYERVELYAYLLALLYSRVSTDVAAAALFYCMRKGSCAARALAVVPDLFPQLLTAFERTENTADMQKMLAALVYTLARLHEVCPIEVAEHVRMRPHTQQQCALLAIKYRNSVMRKLCMTLAVM